MCKLYSWKVNLKIVLTLNAPLRAFQRNYRLAGQTDSQHVFKDQAIFAIMPYYNSPLELVIVISAEILNENCHYS